MYYYRKNEDKQLSFVKLLGIFAIGVVIEFLLVYLFIPYLPKLAAFFDRIFVNGFGLPYNTGAIFFLVSLLALCFWLLFLTLKRGKVFWNTVTLCVTTLIIGFSLFSIVIIRSSVKTPTNEYQPDNPYTLVRYLNREQYGSQPLVYGQYFDAPCEVDMDGTYWAPIDGKYVESQDQPKIIYTSAGKMFFPRMWSSDGRHIKEYLRYYGDKEIRVRGAVYPKPSFWTNMAFFVDYQLNWMYWRYFMWNFVGRQNDIHGESPGDLLYGNWESGIRFLDAARLGDQSDAPAPLKENRGKNHYFFLPLLLGLLGVVYQFGKDKRGSWLVFLMFFMTGIAIVLYLNQPPLQVRERDYAYAGSFYMFAIWIGLGVVGLVELICEWLRKLPARAVSSVVSLLCLGVPALMAAQNWDDHDRSNRYTAVEMARNYLNSVGPNGYLVTHGDNDTFPLWYAQEVEGVRTDVRVVNTSLLGTDWYIDQMKWACNESAPLPLQISQRQYLYGTNEWVEIRDTGFPMLLSDVMEAFRSGRGIGSRKLVIPVNRENCLKYGIVPEMFADEIPESITLTISQGKNYLSKPELFMLDLLSSYEWDRPLNLLSKGGDLNIGLTDYLMYDVFSYRFTPIRNKIESGEAGKVDALSLYYRMKNVFTWDALRRTDYYADYQNQYTFLGVLNQRELFLTVANALMDIGENEKALEMLDLLERYFPESQFPLEGISQSAGKGFAWNDYYVARIIEDYYLLDAPEKARRLAGQMEEAQLEAIAFYCNMIRNERKFWSKRSKQGDEAYRTGMSDLETKLQLAEDVLFSIAKVCVKYGDEDLGYSMVKQMDALERGIYPVGEDSAEEAFDDES